MYSHTIKLPFNNYIIYKHNDTAVTDADIVTDANIVADVDTFPRLDVKTKLVDALLRIHSMEYRVYELEGEIDRMGGIM